MNWKEKFTQRVIRWLLRYAPEWADVHEENAAIRREAAKLVVTATEIAKENEWLRGENQRLKEEAEAIAGIDLVAENTRLRAEAEGARDAYNALLEEMEGQL
jgi:hypothetical protein